jgi:hypothetical protein
MFGSAQKEDRNSTGQLQVPAPSTLYQRTDGLGLVNGAADRSRDLEIEPLTDSIINLMDKVAHVRIADSDFASSLLAVRGLKECALAGANKSSLWNWVPFAAPAQAPIERLAALAGRVARFSVSAEGAWRGGELKVYEEKVSQHYRALKSAIKAYTVELERFIGRSHEDTSGVSVKFGAHLKMLGVELCSFGERMTAFAQEGLSLLFAVRVSERSDSLRLLKKVILNWEKEYQSRL